MNGPLMGANALQQALCCFATNEQIDKANEIDRILSDLKIDTILVIVGPCNLWGFYDMEIGTYTWGYDNLTTFMKEVQR